MIGNTGFRPGANKRKYMTRNEINIDLLQQAVLASNDGIVIADDRQEDCPVIYVNPAFERLTGYSAEEVINRNCRFLQGDEPDQAELDILRSALKAKKPCIVKLRNYRRDGTMFWNELSISPVYNEDNEVTHFIGIQKDITTRVEAEIQLQEKQKELEEANSKLQDMAIKDGLTGIYNRRYFNDQIDVEWNRALREKSIFTVFMIDIDDFKQYNDHYGHKAGDVCIQKIATSIQSHFNRASDLVARYGGEEFIVIVTGVDSKKAFDRAEKLREYIEQLYIPHSESSTGDKVTISIGMVSRVADTTKIPYQLVESADEALYKAKSLGKNQVVNYHSFT
jgi:diguanylate cyclase (GGDEF)-like protein/PAS domain S-box-containing protein